MKKLYMLPLLSLLILAPDMYGMWWEQGRETAEEAKGRRAAWKEGRYSRELVSAAGSGNLVDVKYYIEKEGIDVNTTRSSGSNSALGKAAENGHMNVVTYLLEQGADPTIKNMYEQTPEELARKNNHFEIANLLRRKTSPSGALGAQIAVKFHEFKKTIEEERKRAEQEDKVIEQMQKRAAAKKFQSVN